jgi:CobQ-like glutamine amidotransferase family enzyme
MYSDNGNILALCYRMESRGIETEVVSYGIDDTIDFAGTDILYIGGGTDREQQQVCRKLASIRDDIIAYAEGGGCIIATCGGFEMLGKNCSGTEGIGLLDIYTEYDKKRFTGDAVIHSDLIGDDIAGFENHSGRIYTGDYTPLGTVVYGSGNNGKDGKEGILYKNVIGTYLHGPILPKNPKLTDYIIKCALDKKYNTNTELKPLDDTTENMAREYIVNRYGKQS